MTTLEILAEKTAEAVTDLDSLMKFDATTLGKDRETFYERLGKNYLKRDEGQLAFQSYILGNKYERAGKILANPNNVEYFPAALDVAETLIETAKKDKDIRENVLTYVGGLIKCFDGYVAERYKVDISKIGRLLSKELGLIKKTSKIGNLKSKDQLKKSCKRDLKQACLVFMKDYPYEPRCDYNDEGIEAYGRFFDWFPKIGIKTDEDIQKRFSKSDAKELSEYLTKLYWDSNIKHNFTEGNGDEKSYKLLRELLPEDCRNYDPVESMRLRTEYAQKSMGRSIDYALDLIIGTMFGAGGVMMSLASFIDIEKTTAEVWCLSNTFGLIGIAIGAYCFNRIRKRLKEK